MHELSTKQLVARPTVSASSAKVPCPTVGSRPHTTKNAPQPCTCSSLCHFERQFYVLFFLHLQERAWLMSSYITCRCFVFLLCLATHMIPKRNEDGTESGDIREGVQTKQETRLEQKMMCQRISWTDYRCARSI